MGDRLHRVDVTSSYLRRLEAIEAFLAEAGAQSAFDDLLEQLRTSVVPHLARFPRIGRRHLDRAPGSAEALALIDELAPGAAEAMREYLHGDYLTLHTVADDRKTVYLLSIRHHREMSFDFAGLWPGP